MEVNSDMSILIIEDDYSKYHNLATKINKRFPTLKIYWINRIGNYSSVKLKSDSFPSDVIDLEFNPEKSLEHKLIILDLKIKFSQGDSPEEKKYQADRDVWGGVYIANLLINRPSACRNILVNSAFAKQVETFKNLIGPLRDLEKQKRLVKWDKKSNEDEYEDLLKHVEIVLNAEEEKTYLSAYDIARIRFAASTDYPVLLLGATGTGKERFARYIHNEWCAVKTNHRPFLSINCAFLSGNLLQDQLFGHIQDAFTGATYHKLGIILRAAGLSVRNYRRRNPSLQDYIGWLKTENNGVQIEFDNNSDNYVVSNKDRFGTLFLDEIGEAPLEVQGMLLRLISENPEITPLGTEGSIQLNNLRIIAATSNPHWFRLAGINIDRDDIRQEVKPDLFYRLAWHRIHVTDIEDWELPTFIDRHNIGEWEPDAIQYLKDGIANKLFKGNRRELRSILDLINQFMKKKKDLGLSYGDKVTREIIDLVWKPAKVNLPLHNNHYTKDEKESKVNINSKGFENEFVGLLAYCFNSYDSCNPLEDWFDEKQFNWNKAKEHIHLSSSGHIINVTQEKHESIVGQVIIWAIRLIHVHNKMEVREIHNDLSALFNKYLGFTSKHMKGQFPFEWYLGTGPKTKSIIDHREKTIQFMVSHNLVQNKDQFEKLLGRGRQMASFYKVMKSATLYELISSWPKK